MQSFARGLWGGLGRGEFHLVRWARGDEINTELRRLPTGAYRQRARRNWRRVPSTQTNFAFYGLIARRLRIIPYLDNVAGWSSASARSTRGAMSPASTSRAPTSRSG